MHRRRSIFVLVGEHFYLYSAFEFHQEWVDLGRFSQCWSDVDRKLKYFGRDTNFNLDSFAVPNPNRSMGLFE
jgi:hypothetical protein